jgi:hypothetical protein
MAEKRPTAGKKPAAAKPPVASRQPVASKQPVAKKASSRRRSWLDESGGVAIDEQARRLESYVQAIADGVVTDKELAAQEKRVVALMKEVEPQLDDAIHDRVSQLLVELVAYDAMQVLHTVSAARTKVRWRG